MPVAPFDGVTVSAHSCEVPELSGYSPFFGFGVDFTLVDLFGLGAFCKSPTSPTALRVLSRNYFGIMVRSGD